MLRITHSIAWFTVLFPTQWVNWVPPGRAPQQTFDILIESSHKICSDIVIFSKIKIFRLLKYNDNFYYRKIFKSLFLKMMLTLCFLLLTFQSISTETFQKCLIFTQILYIFLLCRLERDASNPFTLTNEKSKANIINLSNAMKHSL